MTIARRKQLRLDVTPFYHCITRCVRRAFLCGKDKETGKRFGHRRGWIEQHLLLLSNVFCIDLAGYAVMSNHYHVILHVDQKKAQFLTDQQVIERWFQLYKGPEIIHRHLSGDVLTEAESEKVRATIALWRDELTNISRFIGNLNQTIARRANKEDDCKGRFWESRFKLQAILDDAALLRTLCYVDLNPVRAGIARTPETSKYTSVRRRLRRLKSGLMLFANSTAKQVTSTLTSKPLPIGFKEYLELLDYTGREIRRSNPGHIDGQGPSILMRLGFKAETWAATQKTATSYHARALGSTESIDRYCAAIGQRWIWRSGT